MLIPSNTNNCHVSKYVGVNEAILNFINRENDTIPPTDYITPANFNAVVMELKV
jgi:hypothetical protein